MVDAAGGSELVSLGEVLDECDPHGFKAAADVTVNLRESHRPIT
jgi:hypothetical protein